MVSLGHNELHDPYIGSWSPGQAAGFTTRRTSLWIFTSDIIATTDRSGCTYPGTGLSYHGPNILVISIISCNEPERSAVIGVRVCVTSMSHSQNDPERFAGDRDSGDPWIFFKSSLTCLVSPHSKVHGTNMGPIWGWQDPGGPHVGPMNFAIWVLIIFLICYLS